MKSIYAAVLGIALSLGLYGAWAHSAICNCYDEGDGTVICEGGFSDGTSAAGVGIRVVDERERVLVDGKMDADGTFKFAKPDIAEFFVVFDAGQGHSVTIFSDDIE